MGKKDFKGLRVYMEDPRKEKMRASRYFIDLITNHHGYNSQDIKLLAEGKITYDDVIQMA